MFIFLIPHGAGFHVEQLVDSVQNSADVIQNSRD